MGLASKANLLGLKFPIAADCRKEFDKIREEQRLSMAQIDWAMQYIGSRDVVEESTQDEASEEAGTSRGRSGRDLAINVLVQIYVDVRTLPASRRTSPRPMRSASVSKRSASSWKIRPRAPSGGSSREGGMQRAKRRWPAIAGACLAAGLVGAPLSGPLREHVLHDRGARLAVGHCDLPLPLLGHGPGGLVRINRRPGGGHVVLLPHGRRAGGIAAAAHHAPSRQ